MQLLKHYVQINHSAFSASCKDPYIVMQASSLRGASEPVIIFTYISNNFQIIVKKVMCIH